MSADTSTPAEDAGWRATAVKPVDAWWTVLFIDPIAVPIVGQLRAVRAVTPNRLTAVAFFLGVLSAVLFVTGHYVLGAAVFEVRFLVDCLDGKLARVRRQFSQAGAFFDIASDVGLTALIFGCFAHSLAGDEVVPVWLASALVGTFLFQYWTWLYLQQVGKDSVKSARSAAPPSTSTSTSTTARLRARLARRRLALRPRSVDVEAFALFIAPIGYVLLDAPSAMLGVLVASLLFYVVAIMLNTFRIGRVLTLVR